MLAKSFGAFGARVADTAGFGHALRDGLAYARERRLPALIELACDPDVLTPATTVQALRSAEGGH
jgi:acetolactate synthase-1/2/3 large subunit